MVSGREGLPDRVGQRDRKEGPPDREIRFRAAAAALAQSILRNRPSLRFPNCPLVFDSLDQHRTVWESQ
jgi:hypothetical protein